MKHWLFFLLLIVNSTCLLSQPKLKHDSAYIETRSFDTGALKQLKNGKDFQYNKSSKPALSLWDKFWNWFWWKVAQLLRTKGGKITFWSILIILGIGIVVFFVLKISGLERDGLFGRSSKGLQKDTLSQIDIHRISFDDAIVNAINNSNYRLATRLQYLQALKKLSDKGYIDWRINKTNTDYLSEIKARSFNDTFTGLTLNFEYIWYGEKQVSKEEFFGIRRQFQQFNNEV